MKKIKNNFIPQSGFSLIEAVIAIAIITIILVSMVAVFQTMIIFEKKTIKTRQATMLADQAIEVAKSLRDDAWSNIADLTIGQNYYLNFDDVDWSIGSIESTVNGFTQTVTAETAYRDNDGKIAETGTADDSTRLIVVDVSWLYASATSTVTTKTYLTDLFSE